MNTETVVKFMRETYNIVHGCPGLNPKEFYFYIPVFFFSR
jgi:hypothetical protein